MRICKTVLVYLLLTILLLRDGEGSWARSCCLGHQNLLSFFFLATTILQWLWQSWSHSFSVEFHSFCRLMIGWTFYDITSFCHPNPKALNLDIKKIYLLSNPLTRWFYWWNLLTLIFFNAYKFFILLIATSDPDSVIRSYSKNTIYFNMLMINSIKRTE